MRRCPGGASRGATTRSPEVSVSACSRSSIVHYHVPRHVGTGLTTSCIGVRPGGAAASNVYVSPGSNAFLPTVIMDSVAIFEHRRHFHLGHGAERDQTIWNSYREIQYVDPWSDRIQVST